MMRRLAAPLVGAALFPACSSPPDKERHQAEGAIAAAREAGAEAYAANELTLAETSLNKYEAAVADRDYRLALSLAVEARDTAYRAAKHAADGKAAARSEAEQLEADVTRLVRLARAKQPSSTSRPATKVRTTLAEADIALQEARAAAERGDYRGASARLEPVDRDLRAELGAAAGPAVKHSR